MSNFIKQQVQKKNNLFKQGKFNLDLTYITDNVIGMSYPASTFKEKIYRNSINDVQDFFT